MFYYMFLYVLKPMLRLMFRPKAEGLQNIPDEGPAIVVGNHLSFSDHFVMPTILLNRRITFLAKQEYFTGPGVKGRLVAAFFRSLGQIPVDRSGRGGARAAIEEGLGVLRKGELLGIYPEGTRSPDGRLYKGHLGVAAMAVRAQVPVIPCAMIGTYEVQPTGRIVPKLGRVSVRFGEPLDFARFAGMENHKVVLRTVTDEIMYDILKLSGQEYVDRYAQEMKAELEAAKAARKAEAEPHDGTPAAAA